MRFSGPGFSGAVSRADRDGPARQGARKEGGEGDEGEYCGAVIACISYHLKRQIAAVVEVVEYTRDRQWVVVARKCMAAPSQGLGAIRKILGTRNFPFVGLS